MGAGAPAKNTTRCLARASPVFAGMPAPESVTHMTALRSTFGRDDGYGNEVFDEAIFELTARKPKAELYSIIPKGDRNKPKNKGRLSGLNGGDALARIT